MRQARPAADWARRPTMSPERQVRLLYRHLVARWGASRDELRLISVPVVLWLARGVALAGPDRITVLARGRPDRRVQLHHVNHDQSVTFSAGRLEADVLAPWTNPLRRVLFEWLSGRAVVTGIDASLVCTGAAAWHPAQAQAAACALGCHVGVWTELLKQGEGPHPFWPDFVEWPVEVAPVVQAWRALAGVSGSALTERAADEGWAWVILDSPGPMVLPATGVRCVEGSGQQDAAFGRDRWPLWALPPAPTGAGDASAAGQRTSAAAGAMQALGSLAGALQRGDAARLREAVSALAVPAEAATGPEVPAAWLVLDQEAPDAASGDPRQQRTAVPRPALCRLVRRTNPHRPEGVA